MSLIEGIGDELTLVGAGLLGVLVTYIAWLAKQPGRSSPARTQQQSNASAGGPRAQDGPAATTATSHSSDANHRTDNLRQRHRESNDTVPGAADLHPGEAPSATSAANSASGTRQDGQISVRIKFLNDRERTAYTSTSTTLGDFKRANFQAELGSGKQVRLIYRGQVLRDDSRTLAAYNIVDDTVFHGHIANNQSSGGPSPGRDQSGPEHQEINLGGLMVPLLSLALFALWYLRFEYTHLFDGTATFSLAFLTGLFVIGILVRRTA